MDASFLNRHQGPKWKRDLGHATGPYRAADGAAFVNPYVKTNKSDRNDAEVICEALSRKNMRFVPVKTAERQVLLSVRRPGETGSKNSDRYALDGVGHDNRKFHGLIR